MAEYSEVIKQFKRMCKSVTPMKCTRGECPMGCENIGQCRKVAFERPQRFEELVMSWAAEHPEPVYPNWSQWLVSIGVIPKEIDNSQYRAIIELGLIKPIPADIAERLGIKPKEG